jgi:hypothetical protein
MNYDDKIPTDETPTDQLNDFLKQITTEDLLEWLKGWETKRFGEEGKYFYKNSWIIPELKQEIRNRNINTILKSNQN